MKNIIANLSRSISAMDRKLASIQRKTASVNPGRVSQCFSEHANAATDAEQFTREMTALFDHPKPEFWCPEGFEVSSEDVSDDYVEVVLRSQLLHRGLAKKIVTHFKKRGLVEDEFAMFGATMRLLNHSNLKLPRLCQLLEGAIGPHIEDFANIDESMLKERWKSQQIGYDRESDPKFKYDKPFFEVEFVNAVLEFRVVLSATVSGY